jgi:hypothetical protein
MALTITLGTTAKLQLKVPAQGETNWANDFKTEFAQKIVDHDHTGVDGKGSKIATAALEDNAVTTAKITDLNVTTAKIANLNVTTGKIADDAVTNAKMGTDIPLATLSNVSSSAPSSGQVLKWSGSEWAPATDQSGSGSGVSITTIATQSDANAYTPAEGHVLKVTGAVTFTDETFNKIDIYVADGITLTFDSSDVNDCRIIGGNVTFKGTSSHSSATAVQTSSIDTFSIQRCQIFCHDVRILQELAKENGRVTTTVKDTFINCETYLYHYTYTSQGNEIGDDNNTTSVSTFNNVTIFTKSEATLPSQSARAVAICTNVLHSGLSVVIPTRRTLFRIEPSSGSAADEEVGSTGATVKSIAQTGG